MKYCSSVLVSNIRSIILTINMKTEVFCGYSVTQSCLILCDPMDCSTPGFPVHHQFPKLAQTHVHRIRDAILTISPSAIPFSSCLQSFPASGSFQIYQFFISSGQSIGSSFNISPSSEHPGLIFRMDWLDLLAVQGTLKSLLQQPQFKSINSSVLSFLYSPTLTPVHDY